MRGNIKELHISVGLPGCGKTTLFSELAKSNLSHSTYIDCDKLLYVRKKYPDMKNLIEREIGSYCRDKVYLDGLFLRKADITEVLKILSTIHIAVEKVIIHYWIENRESCKHNDQGRRDKSAIITIENADFDSFVKIESIKDEHKMKFEFQKYEVMEKEDWKVFADINNLYADKDGMVRGESWSCGGTWQDCWGNGGGVSAETPPNGMRELDDLLMKICPNISFLQYKKITNDCVSTEDYSEGDWYGGSVTYNRYVFNVENLYNTLKEMELI